MAKQHILLALILVLVMNFVGSTSQLSSATPDIKVHQTRALPQKGTIVRKALPRTPATSRSYARLQVFSKYGWRHSEYVCLRDLWEKESHWNHKADNPQSSAYGIPQLLGLKATDPQIQINAGLKYVKQRYGTPCEAWSFWKRHKWY